jgi:K+-transporting ATPase ATPase A chain
MHWLRYALALLAFNAIGAVFLYALQRLQGWLPLNPAGMAAVSSDSAFNTAVSFVSNTNWQGYAGESTMSYLTQMLGLTVQNFSLGRHRHRGGLRAGARLRAPR